MKKNYKNIILTNHALKHSKTRSLKLKEIYQTINHSDYQKNKNKNQVKYY